MFQLYCIGLFINFQKNSFIIQSSKPLQRINSLIYLPIYTWNSNVEYIHINNSNTAQQ